MARKAQISKETILETAFQMLLQDGYSSINITNLAKAVGCSTQPIAWCFGSMDGLREELLEYCLAFMKDRFSINGDGTASVLDGIAYRYIELAFDYPNLYKYLYMSEQDTKKMGQLVQSLRSENYDKIRQMIVDEHGISEKDADRYILNMQLYVHGIASYAVSKVSFPSKEEVMQMVHEANEAFLQYYKQ